MTKVKKENKQFGEKVALLFIVLEVLAGLGIFFLLNRIIGSDYNFLILIFSIVVTVFFTKILIEVHHIVVNADLNVRIKNKGD